jgi:hypothetical protein
MSVASCRNDKRNAVAGNFDEINKDRFAAYGNASPETTRAYWALCSCCFNLRFLAPYADRFPVISNSAYTWLAFSTSDHQAAVLAPSPSARSRVHRAASPRRRPVRIGGVYL